MTADLTRELVRPNTGLQQPQEATNWLAVIVSSSTDAIIRKTCDGVVTSFNPAAERLFGYRAEEIIGKPVRILIPADRQEEEDRILARIAAGHLVEHYETIRLYKNGSPIEVSISVCPIRDASGRIMGAGTIARDITEHRRADAELERMRIMLAEGQRIAHLGSFEYIAATQETVWSDEEKRIYGLDPAGPSPAYEDMLRHHIHPEDAAELDRGFREAFQSAAVFENENRIVRPDGSIRWIYNRAHPYFDSSGQLVKYIGATLDITERKRTEAERQKFVSLADHSIEFIGICDLDFKPFYVNEAGRRLVGLDSLEQACAARVQDYFFPEDQSMITNEFFPRVLRNGSGEVEVRFRHFKTGGALWMIYNVFAVKDEGGRIAGYATVSRDITGRKKRESQVQLLLREVNHRAKNLLGVVQAIASQMATSQPEDFIARFSERIQALAANQDLLVRSQWQGVELRDLVRAQLAHFEGLIGSRIEIAGPPLYVTAEAAQPIAMGLHELATNAGKYGALSGGKGKVSIAWDIGRDETFHLSWTETAGPVVTSPTRRGFGTTVIAYVPEAQLGADVTLDYPPGGVTWRLVCPAENVLQPRSAGANGRVTA
jgi:PAS domain S-box-containing protein